MTMELLDCVLIGVSVVIKSNAVNFFFLFFSMTIALHKRDIHIFFFSLFFHENICCGYSLEAIFLIFP